MKKSLFFSALIFFCLQGFSQYKNDNVLFKTVYPQDLCSELIKNPGYLLLDVRSPGEYADTSSMGMNIGKFSSAVNINVRELGKRLGEISEYKNKPVFVYCSHSQRSRRASKMLADSGFTNVHNINGGMTAIQQFANTEECFKNILQVKLPYKLLGVSTLCKKMATNSKSIFILDVRDDSAFKHISTDAKINAMGYFKNSTHIPLDELAARLGEISLTKEIIVVDIFGDDAEKAAMLLTNKNFKQVSMLVEGVDRFTQTDSRDLDCKGENYISPVTYHILSGPELWPFTQNKKDMLVLDIRSTEEFTNKHKNYWMNLGHMVNAVNIPVTELGGKISSIENYKTKPVLLYAFGSGPTAYEAANMLSKQGFTDIYVLAGGIFNIRWTGANVKGNEALMKLVTDVPVESL